MAWDLCPQGVMDLQILDLKFSGNLPRPENCRRYDSEDLNYFRRTQNTLAGPWQKSKM